MVIIGWIIVIAGCLAALVGELLMLKMAYRYGPLWFIACLLLAPLTWLALLALDFKAAGKPFALALGGVLAVGMGGMMAGINYG